MTELSSTARRLSHPNAMELIEVLEDQQYLCTVASLCTAFPDRTLVNG